MESDQVKAREKRSRQSRAQQRLEKKQLHDRDVRPMDELPNSMRPEHYASVTDEVAGDEMVPKKRRVIIHYSILQRDSYEVGTKILASFVVGRVARYCAGTIQAYDTDTANYFVQFLDGETRDDVKLNEILCYGWFRLKWKVFAPVKGTSNQDYLANVIHTNYYNTSSSVEDEVLEVPYLESPEVINLLFDKHESEKEALEEHMVSIRNLNTRLDT